MRYEDLVRGMEKETRASFEKDKVSFANPNSRLISQFTL